MPVCSDLRPTTSKISPFYSFDLFHGFIDAFDSLVICLTNVIRGKSATLQKRIEDVSYVKVSSSALMVLMFVSHAFPHSSAG